MPGKFKIVVSDLHLSAGRASEGNPLEDFGSDYEFAQLLEEVIAESDRDGAEVELIFNGDAFEMLQVPHVEVFEPTLEYPPKQYHLSTEEASVLKMKVIIDGHRPFFEALGRFLRVGPPRRYVTFVKGNHDLNLYWPGVQACIRDALSARSGRQSLVGFEERFICREGIYVEHGNMYAESVDQPKSMEDPRDEDDLLRLDLPLGSWFVMDVFNKVEREKYWIDGVKPITALVWYALAFDFRFAVRAIAQLAGALPSVLWQGLRTAEAPSAEAMERQLEDPVQMAAMEQRYESDDAFRAQFNAELAAMLGGPAGSAKEPLLSARGTGDPVDMGNQIRARVKSSLYDMAAMKAAEEGVTLVTFGHTHDASEEELPGGATYINSGTWTWRADLGSSGKEAWKELFAHPESFTNTRLLSYVRIEYDADGRPRGTLESYEPGRSGRSLRAMDSELSIWHKIEDWFRRLGRFLRGGM